MPIYTISGRVVTPDGLPLTTGSVTVYEVVDLSATMTQKGAAQTPDSNGRFTVTWTEGAPTTWDLLVRATDGSTTTDSHLINDLEDTATVDIVLGNDTYQGRTEFERVEEKVAPLLGATAPRDIPMARVEWLARRANVFPIHLSFYIQAERIADGNTIKAQSCYAFMRAGLPVDLPALIRAGDAAWEAALRNGWEQKILPLPGGGSDTEMDDEVADEIEAMRELMAAASLDGRANDNPNAMFATASAVLSGTDNQTFMDLWLARTSLSQFWADLTSSLGSTKADRYQFTIQAAIIANRDTSVLTGLQTEFGTNINSVKDLASWSESDWDGFLVTYSVTAPDEVPGADATEKRQNYARALNWAVEDAYPTKYLRHAIERDEAGAGGPANTEYLATFLSNNDGFDIERSTISNYLGGAGSPWTGIDPGDQADARANLDLVQRVYRMLPKMGRYDGLKVLLDNGIASAAQVVEYTREEFVDAFGSLLPDDAHHQDGLAGAVWDKATQIHAGTIMVASQLGMGKSDADFGVLDVPGSGQFESDPDGLSDLSTILGNLDYCACEHCRSVFSPAAYLADLLAFLSKRPAIQATNALEALSERRPDIRHILLDCDNTNTPLPYIDLVNELLEAKFAGEFDAPVVEDSHQTTWTAEELRIHPEHLDMDVYDGTVPTDGITELVFPWNLPFSLPAVEARVYLEHLGVPRHQLLTRFLPKTPDNADRDRVAAAVLGLNETEYTIVAGSFSNPSDDDREFWGWAAGADADWDEYLNGTYVGVEGVGDITQLLVRGRYTIDELKEWLALDYIDPNGQIEIQWGETCALEDATISFLEDPELDRLHRLTRLHRRCKIPARMLNVLVVDVCGGTLDGAALRTLGDMVRVNARLGLAWDELATLWASVIDARDYADKPRALYTRRFLSKEFQDIGASELDNFLPNGSGLQGESNPPGSMTDTQRVIVLAALGIKESELTLLMANIDLTNDEDQDSVGDDFSFANLTALFRCVTFARAMGLTIADFTLLAGSTLGLSGMDPFTDPQATLDFIDMVDGIRDSGLSVAELDWLLRHGGEELLDEDSTGHELVALARALATIVEETSRLNDPDGAALATNLAELISGGNITTVLAIVEMTTQDDAATKNSNINTILGAYVDVSLTQDVLVNDTDDYIADVPGRRGFLLGQIVSFQRRRALVIDTISSRFEVSATVAEMLAFTLLDNPGGSGKVGDVLMPVFADEDQIATGVTSSTHANEFDTWMRVTKAAMLCERHELRADEVEWYSGGDSGAWLDVGTLPLSTQGTAASFDEWNKLRLALSLRDLFPADELTHSLIAGAASLADGMAVFAAHMDWDASALTTVAGNMSYALGDLSGEAALLHLRTVAETGDRLGVDLVTLDSWATTTPTMAQSTAIKTAARSKYDEGRWAEIAAPLRDVIREQQRDALVDAVIAAVDTLSTPDEVFENLLVDVQMSSCMMTSRIKLAISSVQIYIHRALLHLEIADVEFGKEAISRWEWMKNYRVWEANRKVFLYPENWIEPQLRRNKTPEFAELESTLMQGALDEARVEKALIRYLERLDRVSGLEMAGVSQPFYGTQTWVLGRTSTEPHEYFIRHRQTDGSWDPWEEVPAKIEGAGVALMVRDRRPHIFWINEYDVEGPDEDTPAIRLSISHVERSDEDWGKVQVSEKSNTITDIPWGEPRHLHCRNTNEGIAMFVAAPHMVGIRCMAAFGLDLVDGKIRYLGSNFNGEAFINGNELTSCNVIAFQGNYDFDGQRYVQRNESVHSFYQGDYNKVIFMKRTSSELPAALVHHADVWSFDEATKLRPVVFDDSRRKFLWEPVPKEDYGEGDGDGVDLEGLGNFPLAYYYGDCPPEDEGAEGIQVAPQRDVAQKMHDDVSEVDTWQKNGVPGQVIGLNLLDGIEALEVPAYQGNQLLNQAQNNAQANNEPLNLGQEWPPSSTNFSVKLTQLYHPGSRLMVEAVTRDGYRGLYKSDPGSSLFRQLTAGEPYDDDNLAAVMEHIHGDPPPDGFDFYYDTPYGIYNWEIFYHTPMLISNKLMAEQRFDEAQKWHHFIFNPIELVPGEENDPTKYWRIKPFYEQAGTLAQDQLKMMLGINATPAQQQQAIDNFTDQVKVWEKNPFDPHAVARIRPGVYQRALLRKYIDNLIAWADNLFRRDTIESINEATILYVMVAQLLGRRPVEAPGQDIPAKTFQELDDQGLDAFSNALVQLENYVIMQNGGVKKQGCDGVTKDPWVSVPVVSRFWYFCYPPNPELLAYWDTIEDRLWKIRHCQNIEGVERQLPLFQPPIDPGMLVAAAAAGIDIQSVLAELASGLPPYRFRSVHGRATAFTNTLRGLGSALLQALEKRDAEELARLRSTHELELLDHVRDIRRSRLDEAREQLASAKAAMAVTLDRVHNYSKRKPLSEREDRQFDLAKQANQWNQAAASNRAIGAALALIPQLHIGVAPAAEFGGMQLSKIMDVGASILSMAATEYSFHANQAAITAGYNRRQEDWDLQLSQALKDVARIKRDIAAAEIRVAIAKRELENHDLQAEQTRDLDRYMRDKFTTVELYDWMVGQLSTLYFQTYQLAFDLAKRAERAYRLELAIPDSDSLIIKYGYWDSLHKGLLAGDRLAHDLERLDLAYMDRDIREFELRKSVSLTSHNPEELRKLQETGSCSIKVPEWMFDLDHPGHYLRRVRAVRVTIPAVVGPYTSLGARLELDRWETRISKAEGSQYTKDDPGPDVRFIEGYNSGEAIATSTAVVDGGLFNLDFRDERYLPFEYAGAISDWKLDLPTDTRTFDYRSISDVVLHIDYTARDGGTDLRTAAGAAALNTLVNLAQGQELMQLIVIHDAFPNEWEQFVAIPSSGDQVLTLPVELTHFDYLAQREGVVIKKVEYALLLEDGVTSGGNLPLVTSIGTSPISLAQTGAYMLGDTGLITEQPATWTLTLTEDSAPVNLKTGTYLDRTLVAGMLMIIRYKLAS